MTSNKQALGGLATREGASWGQRKCRLSDCEPLWAVIHKDLQNIPQILGRSGGRVDARHVALIDFITLQTQSDTNRPRLFPLDLKRALHFYTSKLVQVLNSL